MKEKIRKKQEGITLVALVVTIVVLLILAGITITYVFGENGIFKIAQEAKNRTENAIQEEKDYINKIDNMVNEYMNGTGNGEGTDTPTGPEEVPVENIKSDWATIEKIAKEIAKDDTVTSDTEKVTVTVDNKKYTINVGDIFEVKYNDEVRRVRVLGFKHDDLVNTGVYGGNHTKASISFEFYDCLGTHNMNGTSSSNSTNANGWAATEMRTFLEGSSGRGQLSNNSYIKQVKKKYIKTYNSASSVTTSNDYLWLLSASEVLKDGYDGGDARGYAITKEGEQYLYYQKNATEAWNTSSTNRVKYNNGSADSWWLRSPYCNDSRYFCYVYVSGLSDIHNSDLTFDVAPGFCI